MIRTHYSGEIKKKDFGKKVTIAGWVQHVRALGNIAFIKVRDREGLTQVVVSKDNKNFSLLKDLTPESVVAVTGEVKKSEQAHGGFEIIPKKIDVLSKAGVPLPMDISGKIESELDTRLNARFMDLRQTNTKAIFMIRDSVLTGIREYSEDMGFIEIHTPKIVSAGAEGGATLFPLTYFEKRAYLSQSPQLFKQTMMSTGFDKIYEIAPYFRAEPSATTRHVAEFTQWDAEISFIESQEDVLKFLERAMAYSIDHVKKHCGEYLEILGVDLKTPKTNFPRITYLEALKMLEKENKKIPRGADIDSEGEKIIGKIMEKKGHVMYYIIEYPSEERPFYTMEKDEDPEFSHSFDIGYKGLELASGGQREHRYDHLVKRIKEKGLNPADFDFYLSSFQYGMPSHGGFGLGIDRLVQKMLSLPNIREAILFPRDLKRLTP